MTATERPAAMRPPPARDPGALDDALARATDTRYVTTGRGALDGTGESFRQAFGRRSAVVVADETTYAVAGEAAARVLRAAGVPLAEPHVFSDRPRLHADFHHAASLRDRLAAHGAVPVAVGAGTINDLTKLASHLVGRRYMVVATAASMDGYAAFGAAITRDGFKLTLPCPAPRALIADVDVLAAAPAAMRASGFGDLAGKVTAGADWLLADALGIDPIDPTIWDLVQPAMRAALASSAQLGAGDPTAIEDLFVCLTLSGLAMQAARSSRPASGAEHQLSHLWEMQGLRLGGDDVSHGFKVAAGSVLIAELYARLLGSDPVMLDVDVLCRRWPSLAGQEAAVRALHRDPVQQAQALEEVRAKYVTSAQLRDRLGQLRAAWPHLRTRLEAQLLPAGILRDLLVAAGCPTEPEEIGLSRERAARSLVAARQIRRRYTVLDLATEVGLLPYHVEIDGAGTSTAGAGATGAAGTRTADASAAGAAGAARTPHRSARREAR